jgi:predicted nucleic acid-binding protein
VSVTVDSNVLVYALDQAASEKHLIAQDLMLRAFDADVILTAQALAEFINVVRRKHPPAYPEALAQVGEWSITFRIVETTAADVLNAARLAERHRLQFWDSLIWQVARRGGAEWFLSEDLQDGLSIDGITVLNPFIAGNAERVSELLRPPPETA